MLDNISLKSEFPGYATVTLEQEKPPDISNIGMDPATTNLLQVSVSIPLDLFFGSLSLFLFLSQLFSSILCLFSFLFCNFFIDILPLSSLALSGYFSVPLYLYISDLCFSLYSSSLFSCFSIFLLLCLKFGSI